MSVVVGIPARGSVKTATVRSLLATQGACRQRGVSIGFLWGEGSLCVARNRILERFMRGFAETLFWIDSDVVWEPAQFFRLLDHGVDVAAAMYPPKYDDPDLYFVNFDPSGEQAGDLLPIKGAGLGFAAVSRKACKAVWDSAPEVRYGLHREIYRDVFRFDVIDGQVRTEDMAFFADLKAAGFQPWLDPTIRLGHVGEKTWTGSVLDTAMEAIDG